MKLEVGMYVRTKREIFKFVKIDNEQYRRTCGSDNETITTAFELEDVLKASYNIIDLLEVGDYVNGYKVEEVNNNLNEHEGICNSLDTYLWGVNDLDKFEEIVIFENDINSIVTKEQFESMEYKVGE